MNPTMVKKLSYKVLKIFLNFRKKLKNLLNYDKEQVYNSDIKKLFLMVLIFLNDTKNLNSKKLKVLK